MRFRRGFLALAVAGSLGACASFTPASCGGPDDPGAGLTIEPPASIQGLRVRLEGEATQALNKAADPVTTYACKGEGAVYSMRDGKELRAVLQVIRLAPDARLSDLEFLGDLVRAIAGEINEPELVEGTTVFTPIGRDNEQIMKTWFKGPFMLFLSVRENENVVGEAVGIDFDGVLRDSIALEPVPA